TRSSVSAENGNASPPLIPRQTLVKWDLPQPAGPWTMSSRPGHSGQRSIHSTARRFESAMKKSSPPCASRRGKSKVSWSARLTRPSVGGFRLRKGGRRNRDRNGRTVDFLQHEHVLYWV